jgi:GLPGLI family protein
MMSIYKQMFHMKSALFFTVALLSIGVNIQAQQTIDQLQLRIHYTSQSKFWENSPKMSPDEKILDIGTHLSKFYSLWEERREEIKDSVIAHGGRFEDVQNAWGKLPYPRSYQYYVIYKNYPQTKTVTVTDRVFKYHIYTEPLEQPKWTLIGDSIHQTIAGHRCQEAKTSFRGREWNVWFATDIPISDGPWKLCGLPGLILKAEDSKGEFTFNCIEIERPKGLTISFTKENYIKGTRQDLRKGKILIYKDPNAYFHSLGLKLGRGWDANGKPIVHKPKTPVLLENE